MSGTYRVSTRVLIVPRRNSNRFDAAKLYFFLSVSLRTAVKGKRPM